MDHLRNDRSPSLALLSGGVGGARLARGLAAAHSPEHLTVVVNIGDDDQIYGLYVSPDVDTVLYTLAGVEGDDGWGTAGDTFATMARLAELGEDTSFRIGDRDLATNLFRTGRLRAGESLTEVTRSQAVALGVEVRVLPASNDPIPTQIRTATGEWMAFQEYFVRRSHRDDVTAVRFSGAEEAEPAPGAIEALTGAEAVVIAPSNPPLSIWPILAVPGMREAVAGARRVVAVSPLIGGKALRGPADRVMAGLGLPPGNAGVVAAYNGLLTDIVIDHRDAGDDLPAGPAVHVTDTLLSDPDRSAEFGSWLLDLLRVEAATS